MLISIRPSYAEQIMAGTKTVELRRRPPRFSVGGLVVLYASRPVQALVGAFQLRELETDSPSALWPRVAHNAGVAWDSYREYFKGATSAVGLHVGARWIAKDTLSLREIRAEWPGFHPPQSYRYVNLVPKDGVSGLTLSINGHQAVRLSLVGF
ncbi:MAG: ASCH domain-containing protein [Candidatus Thiosymbion ectosymbiont of Robbea hypermnestra]|nr:ASCH domain-containing protein [Candidatus Thiosymbion ectosymbiont of Robbea hypermnestra]